MTTSTQQQRKRREEIKRLPGEPAAEWRRRYKSELMRLLRAENKERYLATGRACDRRNKERKRQRRKARRLANLELFRQKDRAAAKKAAPRRLVINREWAKRNRDKLRPGNRFRTAKYRLAKAKAVPAWADLNAINATYVTAARMTDATGILHHVDHIIPINGKEVCGLHVHNNLRVVPYFENTAKGNLLIEALVS